MFDNLQLTGSERIIKRGDVGLVVNGTCNVDSCLLTSGEVDTLFSDRLGITVGQQIQIGLQTCLMDDVPVSLLVERPSKQNVLSDGRVADPGYLRARSRATSKHDFTLGTPHFAKERTQQRRFS